MTYIGESFETPSGTYVTTGEGIKKVTASYEFEPALIIGDATEDIPEKKFPWWIVLAAGAGLYFSLKG